MSAKLFENAAKVLLNSSLGVKIKRPWKFVNRALVQLNLQTEHITFELKQIKISYKTEYLEVPPIKVFSDTLKEALETLKPFTLKTRVNVVAKKKVDHFMLELVIEREKNDEVILSLELTDDMFDYAETNAFLGKTASIDRRSCEASIAAASALAEFLVKRGVTIPAWVIASFALSWKNPGTGFSWDCKVDGIQRIQLRESSDLMGELRVVISSKHGPVEDLTLGVNEKINEAVRRVTEMGTQF